MGGRGWPFPDLLPAGGGAKQVGEELRMEGARYPGVQLHSCWLLQINRGLEEFAAASPVPGRMSVCSYPQGLADGLVWCAQWEGYMKSSLSANIPGILGKIREGTSRRSWEGRAVGWHLGPGRHVGLTLCLPSACLPHRERQRRFLSEPGRGRGCAKPEPTLTCASQ